MAGFRVVIAGGGVAGLEGLLALHGLAGERVETTLLAPEEEFCSRPLSVAEPFGLASERRFSLREIAREHDARFRHGALAGVDPNRRVAVCTDGARLGYDALLVAVGARWAEAVPGSLTFSGPGDVGSFKGLLQAIERAHVSRLAFAIPSDAAWPLPLYELALLTAARARELGSGVQLELVSPESRPLELFGDRASECVQDLLDEAGVTLRLGRRPRAFKDGELELGDGTRLHCDRVVALPVPVGPELPGLRGMGRRRLLATDRYGKVEGVERVWAAGDVTSFPVKQGGLATQQADAAASAIAEAAGARVDPRPFRPVLRGALITGRAPRFLRAEVDPIEGRVSSVAAQSALWWPPAKVAGRLLAPYLAAKAGYARSKHGELADVEPPYDETGRDLSADHDDVVGLALSAANSSARWRDFDGALRWLEVAEDLELYLRPGDEAKRAAWQELAASDR
jgi:sulfide:quinone oxidoreductase